jgi:hypothetical protein
LGDEPERPWSVAMVVRGDAIVFRRPLIVEFDGVGEPLCDASDSTS